ncbi:AT-hook motif nuclear-localized protein 8-like [Lotus japonicus]|uniref:AT-hook motif nuclear-localized protein 8-like n=1 Tax=Lotus japonicus TaxID=34305 RepID=UPI0025878B30|nr:AT-hook motif nuclear-localized protein 8-like [Lotus japonicus]
MDSRQPPHSQPNITMGPTPYPYPHPNATITPSTMAPRFPPFNTPTTTTTNNNNPSEHFTITSNNTNSDASASLKPCGSASDSVKRKRGRPRKYSPDGNIALGLAPSPSSSAKKNRGRPPGSGKKQLHALGTTGTGFTPHVITVDAGQDIAAKLLAFCQQGPRTVCILSASGAVRNVTLEKQAASGGVVMHEGQFEIIYLSGAELLSENSTGSNRMGGLSVNLAGPDGRILGGRVVGMLTAASAVQVIVGSFIADGKKSNSSNLKSGPPSMPSSQTLTFGSPVTPASPPTSQGPSTESSDDNGNSRPGLYNNASQPLHNMPMYTHQIWAGQTHQ